MARKIATTPQTSGLPSASLQELARISDELSLHAALDALRALDPEPVQHMLDLAGAPPLRARLGGFAGLAWIIVSQQVSTASARAIYARLEARFTPLDAEAVAEALDDDLRSCGLSAPKMRTLRAIAAAVQDGALDFARLAALDTHSARSEMTAIHGIGPWTADIYLLFCLGHADVWPAGDLALQEGVRLALRLRTRPDARELEKISRRWQPLRAVAARLIWAYYGVARPAAAPKAKSLSATAGKANRRNLPAKAAKKSAAKKSSRRTTGKTAKKTARKSSSKALHKTSRKKPGTAAR